MGMVELASRPVFRVDAETLRFVLAQLPRRPDLACRECYPDRETPESGKGWRCFRHAAEAWLREQAR